MQGPSERRRGLPESTARLLRSLLAQESDDEALEAIPNDWRLNDAGHRLIRVAVRFSGTAGSAELPDAIRALTHSRRMDLAGVAWVLLGLAPQGQAAVLVPDGFLAEATQGHVQLRRRMTEEGRLHGIVWLAPGVYKPRSGAALLLLGPEEAGPVWMCEVSDPDELQAVSDETGELALAARWWERHRCEADASHFFVSREAIAAAQFDWSLASHRATDAAGEAPLRPPHEILAELAGLEAEIFQGIRDLVGMLKR